MGQKTFTLKKIHSKPYSWSSWHLLVEKGYFPKGLVGLYRDDGLAVVQLPDKAVEDMKKSISALFKSMGLKLTYEVNTTTTDFLDVKLDLKSGEFKPFMKPNDFPVYIGKQSNNPHTFSKTFLQVYTTVFQQIQVPRKYLSKPRAPTLKC